MSHDNPVSWFVLLVFGMSGFIWLIGKIIQEANNLPKRRNEDYSKIFLENNIDKANIKAYNNNIKKQRGQLNECDDVRYRNYK